MISNTIKKSESDSIEQDEKNANDWFWAYWVMQKKYILNMKYDRFVKMKNAKNKIQ
jgi:hypothetical protein